MVLFVPNQSQYNKLGSNTSAPAEPEEIDLSWQLSLQTVWEKLLQDKGAFEIQNRLLWPFMLHFLVPCMFSFLKQALADLG